MQKVQTMLELFLLFRIRNCHFEESLESRVLAEQPSEVYMFWDTCPVCHVILCAHTIALNIVFSIFITN